MQLMNANLFTLDYNISLLILLRNDLISFNITSFLHKYTNTAKCREIITDKSRRTFFVDVCMCVHKYIEHLNQQQEGKKDEDAHIQTVEVDFSRRREQEPSFLRTFIRLIVLNYKRAR